MWSCSFCTYQNGEEDVLCAACGLGRSPQYPGQHQLPMVGFGAGATTVQCPSCMLNSTLQMCNALLHSLHMHGLHGRTAGPQDVASGGMLPGHGGGMLPGHGGGMLPGHGGGMLPGYGGGMWPGYGGGIDRFAGFRTPLEHEEDEDSATNIPQPARVTTRRVNSSLRTAETARTSAQVAGQGPQPTATSKSGRRIVLLGKTGSGKSATGNSMLGHKAFLSKAFGFSVTKTCNRGTADRFGRRLEVIDTPGLFDTGMSNAEVSRELVKCIGMAAPGPHVFVLVLRIDRFTKEEQDSVNHFKKMFGEGMMNYTVVVFTRKDDLVHNQTTFQKFLNDASMELKTLLEMCDNRCLAFDNRNPPDTDVEAFLQIADSIIIQNGGSWYSNEMFLEAEKAILQRENELRQQFHDGTRDTLAKLKHDFDEQIQKLQEKCSKEVSRLEGLLREQSSLPPAMSKQAGIQGLREQLQELKTYQDENKQILQEAYSVKERTYREIMANTNHDYREMVRKEIQTENKLTMRKFGKMILKVVSVLIPVIAGALGVL